MAVPWLRVMISRNRGCPWASNRGLSSFVQAVILPPRPRYPKGYNGGIIGMKRVSVVVPAYNEEELLPRCLSALRGQDYAGEIEIIVVDNASTDGTSRVASAYGVTVVAESKRGYCSAL